MSYWFIKTVNPAGEADKTFFDIDKVNHPCHNK